MNRIDNFDFISCMGEQNTHEIYIKEELSLSLFCRGLPFAIFFCFGRGRGNYRQKKWGKGKRKEEVSDNFLV